MAGNPETRWKLLNHAMEHYQQYIDQKKNRNDLCFIDLLYISNFKGGNASITESVDTLRKNLINMRFTLKKFRINIKTRLYNS